MRRRSLLFFLMIAIVGCVPVSSASFQRLPTLAPTPTAPIDPEAAQRSAALFLDAWQRQDFLEMYRLISFNSQEAVSFDQFKQAYEDAQNEMTMSGLTTTPRALLRHGDKVVLLTYDVTFFTNLLGQFTDSNRTLNLVLDSRVNDWRVAWSVADIFPEFGDGAFLQFESSIPTRANIYDRNGKVLADQNGIAVRVQVIKDKIPTDEATCMASLVDATGRPFEVVEAIFRRSGQNWVMDVATIETRLYFERHEQLERDCAATFSQQAIRQYPRGSLMPHILGHVGYPDPDEVDALVQAGFNPETIIGKSGIEKSWDEVLRGKPGGQLVMTAADGTRLRVLARVSSEIPESIWLTIDSDLQEYALQTLGEAYLAAEGSWAQTSRGAAAIVMNIKTGELLALVSYPTYEGNAFTPFPAVGRSVAENIQRDVANDNRNPLLNRPVQALYPSGSTMKVVDAIALQETGLMTPDQTFMCTGIWRYGNDTRYDWLAGGHGVVKIETALMQSCNPFFYNAGFLLNERDPFLLPSFARRLGLGSLTGLTDLSEAAGTIGDPDWLRTNLGLIWSYSDAISMAIGQGPVEVTPLQMARLYAGIANHGILIRPRLVRERGILDQRTFLATPEANGNFNVSQSTLDVVIKGLCRVTTDRSGGTAAHIFNSSYGPSPLIDIGVCGKTGTAQDGAAGNGRASHAWFIGWAPRDDPEIITLVMVENSGEGSAVAAPLVRRIMEYYFFGPFD